MSMSGNSLKMLTGKYIVKVTIAQVDNKADNTCLNVLKGQKIERKIEMYHLSPRKYVELAVKSKNKS